MPDTFAHGVRRRPQAPRPIAQACSVRSEGMTGLEVGRLPDRSPRLGSIPRRHVRRLAHRSTGILRPVPPAAVRKGRWGIYEHRCGAFRKRWESKLLILGIPLTQVLLYVVAAF